MAGINAITAKGYYNNTLSWVTTSRPASPTPEPICLKPLIRISESSEVFVKQIWNMEAMLHLLNSKSKKNHRPRSSASACWIVTLNQTTCFTMIGMLLIGLPNPAAAYSYPYYDCSNPSNLQTYDRSSLLQHTNLEAVVR
jgi:hypothetical protein